MKILALDTAMASCSVAIVDTELALPLATRAVAMERGHAEALAPMLQQAMTDSGLAFTDLDRIAVTTGPGTFTGVRIGLAMARGLGLSLGKPVVGLDTLTAIAANARPDGAPLFIAADARNGEIYAASFDGAGHSLFSPAVLTLDAAVNAVPPKATVIGTAADALMTAASRADLQRSTAGDLPLAANIARLAATLALPSGMPAPTYLRAPDAKPQQAPLRDQQPRRNQVATPADAGVLAGIYAECFDHPWSAQEIAQLMVTPGSQTVMVVEGEEPVAFLMTRQAADEAEVITIATRPFARQRGIARALLDHQLTELRKAGVTQAFLEVAKSNGAAQAVYRACGFIEAGLRKGYYERSPGLREDALVMRKDLAP